jgi:1-deoxy-D-xylulose-5-phosphate reductoisomerase
MSQSRRSPKRLALLGATGSIGRQVCDLVERNPERFTLHALIAGHDAAALDEAGRRHPSAHRLLARPRDQPEGEAAKAVIEALQDPEVDLVIVAAMGAAALAPTLAALDAGKDVAIATKEVLVMAGELVRERMRRHGTRLLPIDSEHSAIWQCLWGERRESVGRLILTGSGGPFLRRPLETLGEATIEEALAHPRWKMGPKITIDSATMMNKGLEIIEAHFLFDVAYERIEVVVHPQSVVHSMVEFKDGSVKAQLGVPDMHLPIAVALSYPERIEGVVAAPDLAAIGRLDFEELDPRRFPAVALAREAGRRGGTAPAVLNAANEEAVALFLEGTIRFPRVVGLVEAALAGMPGHEGGGLEAILDADAWARSRVRELAGAGPRAKAGKLPG